MVKQKKQNTAMKRYIKPTCEFIEIETLPLLRASIYMGGNKETFDENAEQLANEHRSDWNNIWGDM